MDAALQDIDDVIGSLLDGIHSLGLDQCINLIILADHGKLNLLHRHARIPITGVSLSPPLDQPTCDVLFAFYTVGSDFRDG